FTKKRWIDDPLTGVAVRGLVGDLIRHFAPKPNKPMTVPRSLRRIVDHVMAIADAAGQQLMQREKLPGLYLYMTASGAPEQIVGVESSVIAQIMKDLGGGLERNQPRRRQK